MAESTALERLVVAVAQDFGVGAEGAGALLELLNETGPGAGSEGGSEQRRDLVETLPDPMPAVKGSKVQAPWSEERRARHRAAMQAHHERRRLRPTG